MKTYTPMFKKALYVQSMKNNLIPLFIIREAGLVVNDVTRIHTKMEDQTDESHCIVTKDNTLDNNLKVPLELDGIFSFFDTRKLSDDVVGNCEYIDTVFLSPDGSE